MRTHNRVDLRIGGAGAYLNIVANTARCHQLVGETTR